MNAKILDFLTAFKLEQELETNLGEIIFEQHSVGDLVLTSGKLVACDPLVYPETAAFTAQLPPGSYPVTLSIAKMPENGDRRVAFALLCLGEAKPIRWEVALLPGENISWLEDGDVFGYPVDSGIGCFMDKDAAILVESLGQKFSDRLISELETTYTHTWQRANLLPSPSIAANIIAFSSGWGDGFYTTYFGCDRQGKIVQAVTNFGLFDLEGID